MDRLFAIVILCWLCCAANAQELVVPISANSPHVFLSLTEERDPDDTSFISIPTAPPREPGLPLDASDHYEVAVYDTGAPTTIISHESFENFDIAGAGRAGANVTELGGVGPSIEAISSDPLGVFAVGFDGLITNPTNGAQIIDRSQLKGSINDSILYTSAGNAIPNLVGTTTSSHYTTVMNYSDPRIIEYNGETHRSPAVNLLNLGSIEPFDRRIGLTIQPGQLGVIPTFFPDVANLNIEDLGNNPTFPTLAGSFWLRANVKNNGVERNQLEAIFDTGAQGSFVSEQLAAEMGFDVVRDDPDFVVRIAGVTGASEEVPGFYADEFHLPGTDGGLRLTNVPLIVFNLSDPRDGVNTLDALIGMNLFAYRDLQLNPEPGRAFLGVSDPAQPVHSWASTAPEASWNAPNSWSESGIPSVDWYALVENTTGTPQIASLSQDSTVAMLVMEGHDSEPNGTITVRLEEDTTLTLFGSAIIQDGSTLHLNNARVSPLAVEIRGGTVSGVGTVEGEVLSQGLLRPGGQDSIGTLEFSGSVDQLSEGVLEIDLRGGQSDGADQIDVGVTMTVDGRLSLFTTDDYSLPSAGNSVDYTIIQTADQLRGSFSDHFFNDQPIGVDCTTDFRSPCTLIPGDGRSFRQHVGGGQFVSVMYTLDAVEVSDYQAIAGDIDGDGDVAFDDFIVMANNFGSAVGGWKSGDFDGNGSVGFEDFLELAENFSGEVGGTAAVPEPKTGVMVVFALTLAAIGRRRHRHA